MVPRRRDPNFVGREEELAALEAALAATGNSALTQPATVHGLGGVGKTLLVIEFAYRHAADYADVLWLAAENPTVLASSLADLARELALPEAVEPDQGVRTDAVLRWLGSPQAGRWLLVFDNAERREDLEPYVPRRHAGHVLITSRNPEWTPLAQPVKVRKLPRPESIELLHKGLEVGEEAEADRLADALGDLPLALAQAAAFVRETGCTFADYRERFQTRGAAFDRAQPAEPGYGRTVAVTLELALDLLREGGSAPSPAEELLARCAFYAPDRIPRDLLAEDLPDEPMLDAAIRMLRGCALVETDAGTVTVHRLVQRVVKERLSPEKQGEYAEHAVQKLSARFPGNPDDVKTWSECRKWLDHALQAIDHAAAQDSAARASGALLNQVGIYLTANNTLGKAEEVLVRALRIMEATNGPDHPEVAIVLTNLGAVAREQGSLPEARRLLERALRIEEEASEPSHGEVARTLTNLGLVARDERHLAEARWFLERALRIEEAVYKPDHPKIARTLTDLGLVVRDQGNLAEARRLLERALRIEEAAYGSNHPEVARTLTNFGVVAHAQGELTEARRLLERALQIFEAAYGPDHAAVARPLTNLGLVARDQGRLAEARRFLERALPIREAAYGPHHPAFASTLTNLGLVAHNQGRLAEARRLLEWAAGIFEMNSGPDCSEVARPLTNLGLIACDEGDLAEARRLQERALRIRETACGHDHPAVASTLTNFGIVARARGELTDARRFLERALRIFTDSYGPDYASVARTLTNLGLVALDQGDLSEARRLQEQALRIHEAAYGTEHPEVATNLTNLGLVARAQGDLTEARRLLERALGIFSKTLGDDHPHTCKARADLCLIEDQISRQKPETRADPETEGVTMTQPSNETPVPTIGIITALPHETAAVRAMLGNPPEFPVPGSGAGRRYWVTEIAAKLGGTHGVVIAQADMGTNIAAVRATLLLAHFPQVESIIMCGIAGGIPNPAKAAEHVRLGDIVVSNQKGVVQYDFVKRTVKKKRTDAPEEVRASSHRPSPELYEAVRILESNVHFGQRPWEERLREGLDRLGWARPDDALDILADPVDARKRLIHPADSERRPGQPRVFLAPIASANTLLRDPAKREALRTQFGVKAVEMEASGIVDATWTHGVGYLVVRGICDYCDANKNDDWQKYAALAAAAYIRALLESMPGTTGRPQ
jgi:nucleoside phosphorylase/Tfp pilus assembly protein PilF